MNRLMQRLAYLESRLISEGRMIVVFEDAHFESTEARIDRCWPAAGSLDTEIGCFRKPEARDAEAKVQSRVQDRGGPPGA
jgi:hypothetical protein